jgi:hypothetical protein
MNNQQNIAQTLQAASDMCKQAKNKEELERVLRVTNDLITWTASQLTKEDTTIDIKSIWRKVNEKV